MLHKHRLMLVALAGVAMAAAGEAGSDTGGAGTGTPGDGSQPPTASPAPQPDKAVKTVAARVLVDCAHGQVNDVVAIAAADLKAALDQGLVDPDKDAVAYARSLPQNRPKPKAS